ICQEKTGSVISHRPTQTRLRFNELWRAQAHTGVSSPRLAGMKESSHCRVKELSHLRLSIRALWI
ncbi:MAG: hypothetical protein JW896_11400, partial [Deltaproteobacteria bacterium]|nr:hypothetical protein [Deltaproteobacteria bacterium]